MSKKERFDSYSHILKYIGLFGGVQALSIGVALSALAVWDLSRCSILP